MHFLELLEKCESSKRKEQLRVYIKEKRREREQEVER